LRKLITKPLFWDNVKKGPGCWEWQGASFTRGYGVFKKKRANRVAWELVHGAIPPGAQVLHRCDNPKCVRPDHLFLGSNLDNVYDMISKGRCHNCPAVSQGDIRVRNSAIQKMHKEGASLGHIGKVFGITRERVRQILTTATIDKQANSD
jgi:hypothetical protein